MKSKSVIILFLSILILDIFYPAYSDEFNFNVTELEITENANIIKGINGGVVNTKNESVTGIFSFVPRTLKKLLI